MKLNNRGVTTTLSDVDNLERFLGHALPDSYKSFLLRQGTGWIIEGGCFFDIRSGDFGRPERIIDSSSVIEFLNLSPDDRDGIYEDMKVRVWAYPPGSVPIASDPMGNSVLLYLREPYYGFVLFWYHDGIPNRAGVEMSDEVLADQSNLGYSFFVAESFERFIESLYEE